MPAAEKPNLPADVPTRCKHLEARLSHLPHMMTLTLELTPEFRDVGPYLKVELCAYCAGAMTQAVGHEVLRWKP